jgi:hypothetical protein
VALHFKPRQVHKPQFNSRSSAFFKKGYDRSPKSKILQKD